MAMTYTTDTISAQQNADVSTRAGTVNLFVVCRCHTILCMTTYIYFKASVLRQFY